MMSIILYFSTFSSKYWNLQIHVSKRLKICVQITLDPILDQPLYDNLYQSQLRSIINILKNGNFRLDLQNILSISMLQTKSNKYLSQSFKYIKQQKTQDKFQRSSHMPSNHALSELMSSRYIPVIEENDYKDSNFTLFFNDHNLKDDLCDAIFLRKHSVIKKGIYVLIKGKILYTHSTKKTSYEKRNFLEQFIKSHGCIISNVNPIKEKNLEEEEYGVIIEHQFSVIQSCGTSYLALEDCSLVPFDEDMIYKTSFFDTKQEIIDLIKNCHYQGIRNKDEEILKINKELLYGFKVRKFHFNSIFSFQYPEIGVVKEGSAVPTSDSQNKTTIQRYALIIPNAKYRANSDFISIIVISQNPTLFFHASTLQQSVTQQKYKHPKSTQTRFTNIYRNQTPISLTKKERKQYSKTLNRFTKEHKQHLIIPMHTCQQNLDFSNKQLKQKLLLKGKYITPHIFFQYHNSRKNRNIPSLKKVFKDNQFSLYRNNKGNKENQEKLRNANRSQSLFRQAFLKNYYKKTHSYQENFNGLVYSQVISNPHKKERKTTDQKKIQFQHLSKQKSTNKEIQINPCKSIIKEGSKVRDTAKAKINTFHLCFIE